MKTNALKISLYTGLGLIGIAGLGAAYVYSRISHEVLSYSVHSIDNNGLTIRVVFGITNPLGFDIDIWNQKYDVFIAGYKTLQITSLEKYRIFARNTSTIPLDVRLKWSELESNANPLISAANASSIGSLPIVIKGAFALRAGILKLLRLPVRMAAPLEHFLP